ncbi:MAG: amino acid permease [Verrucomicrobia bacterium]|nr:amino acid permease [Verrucomicrobiota bacterium]
MSAGSDLPPEVQRPHPHRIGWVGTTSLAMGGSNQSLFLITALFVGQGAISGQGSAAVPLLIVGLLLSWAAAPGWLELVMMYPNRVGGIAATCSQAFKPYSPVLANLTGVCYWWGWVPTCGLTALLSSAAIHEWYLPGIPVPVMACGIVLLFTGVNLMGVQWAARLAIPIAAMSAMLAFISSLAPVFAGKVDWHQASTFHLTLPFPGWFGALTSAMAGLYLIGFAAPAFEAATCHVGETIDPEKNVPRAMLASALMAAVYFIVLPVVWLGVLGPEELGKDLMLVLGPTFAPVLGSAAKAAAIWFMMFNMFHGTLQPLAGASRTLSQLSEDGLLPEFLSWRSRTDVPWTATCLTAAFAIWFLLIGDPIWLIASANFTYLISIGLPSVAVWLLRGDQPGMRRPYRAPRGFIGLGVLAACIWGVTAILGFQQFGLPTVLIGLVFAYSGAALYAWRKYSDRRKAGLPGIARSLHIKLTGAMLLVLILDGVGYLIAVKSVDPSDLSQLAALEDIFVAVAMLTISVGLVLPGMIAHSAVEVSAAARRLASGTVADFSSAMQALGRGDLDAAHARVDIQPVVANSRDEVGEMAESFNILQTEIARGADGLGHAREGLREARKDLTEVNQSLEQRVNDLAASLLERQRVEIQLRQAKEAAEAADLAKSEFLAVMSHEIRTPMNGVLGFANILKSTPLSEEQMEFVQTICTSGEALLVIINDILDFSKIESGMFKLDPRPFELRDCVDEAVALCAPERLRPIGLTAVVDPAVPEWITADYTRVRQILINLIGNAVKFTETGSVEIRVGVEPAPDDANPGDQLLRFSVTDTGIGIPPDKLDSLFKPFSQVDASSTRQYGGTGLGLAICKSLISLMGGGIWAESVEGTGSTFHFTLPAQAAPPPMLQTTSAASELKSDLSSRQALRILVVEDIPMNQVLTLRLLSDFGHRADKAANGRECLEQTRKNAYDIIFMDLHMPEVDGFMATREIRRREKSGSKNARTFICALTANVMKRDRDACMDVGMDHILSKPLRVEDLAEVLQRVRPEGA